MERMADYKPQERQDLEELYRKQNVRINELEQENKKLKEKLSEITMVADDEKQSIEHILELEQESKKLKEEIEKIYLHIEAKDEAYMKLLKDYEELKNCGEYIFDCSKYNFTWLTSTTPQLQVSKKAESGSCFTKID